MLGKKILEATFEMVFSPGRYLVQLEPLDALGMVGKRQQLIVLLKLCEAVDSLETRINDLEFKQSYKPEPVVKAPSFQQKGKKHGTTSH